MYNICGHNLKLYVEYSKFGSNFHTKNFEQRTIK